MAWPLLLSVNDNLLLLLQALHHIDINLQNIRDNIGRGERQPLRQGDISNTIGLVNLDEGEVFGGGCVLNVMACCVCVCVSILNYENAISMKEPT